MMLNKNFLIFLIIFLIINITPTSASQLSDVQKDTLDLSGYNMNKIKKMGFFEKLKLLHKLPYVLAKPDTLLMKYIKLFKKRG